MPPTRSARLPDDTRLGRVRLQAADLDRSIDFYASVLGFRVLDRSSDRAVLGAADDDRPLIGLRERPGAAPAPRRGRLGLYHFAVLLPSREALGRFVRQLEEQGVAAAGADHLVSEALYLWDPDGLGIEVYADRPRDAWRRRDGELVMDTRPLDRVSLLDAAGAERWNGMPTGTVIGHVHLHVGDLRAAREFYHAGVGFDLTVRSYPGALFLGAGGYHHHLGVNTWAGADASRPGPDDARLLDWEVVLPDADAVHAAADRLGELGCTVDAAGDAAIRAADPWGTVVRLRTTAAG